MAENSARGTAVLADQYEYRLNFYQIVDCLATAPISAALNQWEVFKQIFIFNDMTATEIYTPTTVARAAPEDNPKSIVEVAMATSK